MSTEGDAWKAGFDAGGSDIEADLDTLLDQLGVEYEGHPITAIRAEILRARAENERLTTALALLRGHVVDDEGWKLINDALWLGPRDENGDPIYA